MNNNHLKLLDSVGGLDAIIITDPVSKRYLTGFESDDAGTLVITKADAYFIIDARYYEAAENLSDVKVILQKDLTNQIIELLDGSKMVAVSNSVTVAELERLRSKLSDFSIDPTDAIDKALTTQRSVKTESEIESIVMAQRIAEKAFEHILGFIREGVTDIEIAAELEYIMRRNGAERMSFDTIAVSGKNSSVPHGVPTAKRIEAGDFVTMDFGAVINGCHSDMTRTIAVGYVSDEMKKVYDTVLKAQLKAIEAVKNNIECALVDKSARDVISSSGYGEYFTHSTGHGVGYEIHEAPSLSPKSADILRIGNIVTIEPGIYLPTRFGVRIEDMVLVTDNGSKNLTKASKELIIV